MSTRIVTESYCDLCNYGGPLSRPQDFVQRGGYDFCRWCANAPSDGTLSSGGHEVRIEGTYWGCTCGSTYSEVVLKLKEHGVSSAVMDAVPGTLWGATASLHVNTPNWPRTY